MQSIINKALPSVSKTTQAMQSNAGFLSVLLLSVFTLSSCEDALTEDANVNNSPVAVDMSYPSAVVNQNNITVIAKSMMKSLDQVNPAVSNEVYSISTVAQAADLNDCLFAGTEYAEIIKHDALSYDYSLEFLNCQQSENDDRYLGDITAEVIYSSANSDDHYSVDMNSKLKQINRYGEMTVSHLNTYIEVNGNAISQSFDLKVLFDAQGTYFVKSVSTLNVDAQTHQWTSGHLVLTSANEEIDVYIEEDEGLYFAFADGSSQLVSWTELNAL